jgi:DNA-binding protein HU-beta
MNRDELITAVAAKTGLTNESADEVLTAVIETIMDAVRDGDKVSIKGFGTFLLAEYGERTARNPRTGEIVQVPARKRPRFTPGKTFRDMAK